MTIVQMLWLILAVGLVTAEFIIPEAFLLWLGMAAFGVFLVLLGFPLSPFSQALLFLGFSIPLVYLYAAFIRPRARKRAQHAAALLNAPAARAVGEVGRTMVTSMDRMSTVTIGDTLWDVMLPANAPAGTLIRISGADGMVLTADFIPEIDPEEITP